MRKQHNWLGVVMAANLKELSDMEPPTFPEWVLEDKVADPDLFDDEASMNVEEEVLVEKKRKRQKVKWGKRKQVVPEEEEDLLVTDDDESLNETEKQLNKDVIAELDKESDEEDPDSSDEDEQDGKGEDSDPPTNIEMDPNPNDYRGAKPFEDPAPTTIPTENQPSPTPQPQTVTSSPISPFIDPIPPLQTQTHPSTPTQVTREKESVTMTTDAATFDAVATVVAGSAYDAVFSFSKKLRTKHTAKRMKLTKVPEEKELDVEGVTSEED